MSGRTYALFIHEQVSFLDGVYEGNANIQWKMEDGQTHEWDVLYSDGFANEMGNGDLAYCKYCNANLRASTNKHVVPGLNLEE